MTAKKPERIPIREAALLLGEHPARVYSLCVKRELRAEMEGGVMMVERKSVEEYNKDKAQRARNG